MTGTGGAQGYVSSFYLTALVFGENNRIRIAVLVPLVALVSGATAAFLFSLISAPDALALGLRFSGVALIGILLITLSVPGARLQRSSHRPHLLEYTNAAPAPKNRDGR